MNTLDLLKLARESLEELVADPECDFGPSYALMQDRQEKALTALNKKIAELEQPAQGSTCKQDLQVWVIPNGKGAGQFSWDQQDERFWIRMEPAVKQSLTPEQPAQKKPQNCGTGYCSCIECVMEQPAQDEPVGEIDWAGGVENSILEICLYRVGRDLPPGTKLYTRPQAREWVGLTEDEQAVCYQVAFTICQTGVGFGEPKPVERFDLTKYTRAIEAKLKEKNT